MIRNHSDVADSALWLDDRKPASSRKRCKSDQHLRPDHAVSVYSSENIDGARNLCSFSAYETSDVIVHP
jgi:hypothetical protein